MNLTKEQYNFIYTSLIQKKVSEGIARRIANSIRDWDEPSLFSAYNLGGVKDSHGHTWDNHIGVDVRFLAGRAKHMPYSVLEPQGATRFFTTEVSEIIDLVREAIIDPYNLHKLAMFIRSGLDEKVVLDYEFDRPIGEGIYSGADWDKLYEVSNLTIVIKRHATQLFRIHTAYPSPSVDEKDIIGRDIDQYHHWVYVEELREIGLDEQHP